MNKIFWGSHENRIFFSGICKYLLVTLCAIIAITGIDCKNNPVIPPDNLPDTTSHEIVWQIDTIGGWQSRFFDIWGTDENNVYAVGLVYISLDPYQVASIMHWDGSNWTPINYAEGILKSIFGFDKDNIWACGYWQVDNRTYALITHWDGNAWTTWKMDQYPALNAVWGTSSSNLFVCGADGTILKYNGIKWDKMTTNVTESLRCIWGNSKNEIYAVGNTFDTYSWVILKYNGSTWKKIKESSNAPEKPIGELTTVWTCKTNSYYTNEFIGKDTSWSLFGWPEDNTLIDQVRGSGENNIFAVGSFDLIMHYNGSTFRRYDFYKKPAGGRLYGIYIAGKKVFIAGVANYRAIVYRGVQN
jgi:hypothetical protein